jgi:hypothetical protein
MFYSENLSLTVLYCLFEFLKRLESGLSGFEAFLQKIQKNKEIRKGKVENEIK